jgi:hypothetical protein
MRLNTVGYQIFQNLIAQIYSHCASYSVAVMLLGSFSTNKKSEIPPGCLLKLKFKYTGNQFLSCTNYYYYFGSINVRLLYTL